MIVALGFFIMLVIAIVAIWQWQRADQQARISRAGELAAQSVALRSRDLSVSLLLGVEAFPC